MEFGASLESNDHTQGDLIIIHAGETWLVKVPVRPLALTARQGVKHLDLLALLALTLQIECFKCGVNLQCCSADERWVEAVEVLAAWAGTQGSPQPANPNLIPTHALA